MKNTSAVPALALRQALNAWARSNGVMWIYLFKVLLAAGLTLWLAMRFQLPHPSSAVITVFIVMQPQSGQVFAKSVYRLLGTVIGLAVMLTLVALFAQARVLFMVSIAIWIGLCTAGAMHFRDLRSYGCVLSGYTVALIGLPAVMQADTAFMSAVLRVLAISLGIVCSAAVSAAVFPQTSSAALSNALYNRFGTFAGFVADSLRGILERTVMEATGVRYAAEAVGLESLRSVTAFEDPHMRMRSGRLMRLNSEFMALTTRFHALNRLLVRLRQRQAKAVLDAFDSIQAELIEVLDSRRGKPLTEQDAAVLSERLDILRESVRARIRTARHALYEQAPAIIDRRDFETAAELLYRFITELHNYTQTHASLAAPHHEREQWNERFKAKANTMASAVAGIRSGVLILALSVFWILTAWPSGNMFTLNAAAVSALAATTPLPHRTAQQMAFGALVGVTVGFVFNFFLFPHLDGFPLLFMVLGTYFALGAYVSLRPGCMGYGLGSLVFFCFTSIPDNPPVYDPGTFLNTAIAVVLSMFTTAVVSSIILPPNSPWLWRRLERDLRKQLVNVIGHPLPGLANRFDSASRDLLNQAYGLANGNPAVQKELMGWTFTVQEIGHAVIELRQEQARLPDSERYAENTPWQQATRAMGRALARLFLKPSSGNLQRALNAVDSAIACVEEAREPDTQHFEESPLRRIQSFLHFIRTSLLDPHGPLASYAPSETVATGLSHAS
ncbi:putative membrane protein YccC [Pseudomonas duriflava]|uniref:Putative membrane protein YccC n=1 Tax=Pseudomonas duriflava TaxID=459528 RepID=A0A562QJ09_9PSED|nr:FUSC family protein [Pseudomonas duriflava]TWI56758.1 putative membrane protein YccC [Pseudomonas duriflava]